MSFEEKPHFEDSEKRNTKAEKQTIMHDGYLYAMTEDDLINTPTDELEESRGLLDTPPQTDYKKVMSIKAMEAYLLIGSIKK